MYVCTRFTAKCKEMRGEAIAHYCIILEKYVNHCKECIQLIQTN